MAEEDPIEFIRDQAKLNDNRAKQPGAAWPNRKTSSYHCPGPTGEPLAGLIPAQRDEQASQHRRLAATEAIRSVVGKEAETLFLARMDGFTRSEAADYLGWPERDVERVWKQLNRARDRLREAI